MAAIIMMEISSKTIMKESDKMWKLNVSELSQKNEIHKKVKASESEMTVVNNNSTSIYKAVIQ